MGELVKVADGGPELDGIVFDTPSSTKVVVAVVDPTRGPLFRTVNPKALAERPEKGPHDEALRLLMRRTPPPQIRERPVAACAAAMAVPATSAEPATGRPASSPPHPRIELSTARATCSRERAPTALLSADCQRSALSAGCSSPRSESTAA